MGWKILFSIIILGIAIWDACMQTIPNKLVLFGVAVGMCMHFAKGLSSVGDGLLGAVIGGGFFMLFALVGWWLFHKEALGMGDVKLMTMAGFFLGSAGGMLACFLAVMAGGVWAAILLLFGKIKKGDAFAFAPALAIGVLISLWCGEGILSWYQSLIFF